jgi:hypothetical protein
MVARSDGRSGRLYCPTDEPVEYRISGGRWYFNGRQLGLDEPIPPPPDPMSPEADGDDDPVASPLDEASRIVSDAWDEDDED